MPNAVLKSAHDKTGIAIPELEKLWQKAIAYAESHDIDNKDAYANGAIQHVVRNHKKGMDNETTRHTDRNDYVIAPNSIITGADVANYLGSEIPYSEQLGLNPNQFYKVYRPIEEIKDNDFSGKPVLTQHIGDFDASTHAKYADYVAGSAHDTSKEGTEIKGSVTLWSEKAIDDLEKGKKYLSAGYGYKPIKKSGTFNGQKYDIIMTDIWANHIAMVDNPRYKPAIVGDEDLTNKGVTKMKYKPKFTATKTMANSLIKLGMDEDKVEEAAKAADEEAEKEKKAQDEKDEADKKAQDEKDEADKKARDEKDKKAQDNAAAEALKGKVSMDSDTISKMIAAEVAKGIASYKTEFVGQSKALDSACANYEILYGKPNRLVLDSADKINSAILSNSGIDFSGRGEEYKQGMVDALISARRPQPSPTISMDSNSNDLNGLVSDDIRKLMGAK